MFEILKFNSLNNDSIQTICLVVSLMSKLCTQEDWTPSDYSRRTYNKPHDKSRDMEHAIEGTLQPIFYYKTQQLSIITFKSRNYGSQMAHQSGSPFTRLWKPLIDVWLQLLRLATWGTPPNGNIMMATAPNGHTAHLKSLDKFWNAFPSILMTPKMQRWVYLLQILSPKHSLLLSAISLIVNS